MKTKPNNKRRIHSFFIFVLTAFITLYSSLAFSSDSSVVGPVNYATVKPYFTYTWPGDCVYANTVGSQWGAGAAGTGVSSTPNPDRADSTNPSNMSTTLTTNSGWQQTDCPPTTHNGNSNVQTFAVAMYHYALTVGALLANGVQDWMFVCCPVDMIYP